MGFVHLLMRDHATAPKGHHGGGISDQNGISENTHNFCLIIQNSDDAEKDPGSYPECGDSMFVNSCFPHSHSFSFSVSFAP